MAERDFLTVRATMSRSLALSSASLNLCDKLGFRAVEELSMRERGYFLLKCLREQSEQFAEK